MDWESSFDALAGRNLCSGANFDQSSPPASGNLRLTVSSLAASRKLKLRKS